MTARAFVLIETSIGRSAEVAGTLRAVPEVQTVDVVTGPYDIIAMIEAHDLGAIGKAVTDHVHAVPGIVRTVTCLSVSHPT